MTLQQQLDLANAEGFMNVFTSAGNFFAVPIPILLALASRETEMGTSSALGKWKSSITGKEYGGQSRLKPMEGDGGHGHGLIQVDDRSHSAFLKEFGEDGYKNIGAFIAYGTWILRDFMNQIIKKGYSGETMLKMAFAAYNKGNVSNVSSSNPDSGTANGNYASDTFKRWQEFARLFNDNRIPDSKFAPTGVPSNLWASTVKTFFPIATEFNNTVKPSVGMMGGNANMVSSIIPRLPNIFQPQNLVSTGTSTLPLPGGQTSTGSWLDILTNAAGKLMNQKEQQTVAATNSLPSWLPIAGGAAGVALLIYLATK